MNKRTSCQIPRTVVQCFRFRAVKHCVGSFLTTQTRSPRGKQRIGSAATNRRVWLAHRNLYYVLLATRRFGDLAPTDRRTRFFCRPGAAKALWTEGRWLRVTRVVIRDGESPEGLLKRFRKQVTQDGILSTVKRKRFFVPKSEQRRIAQRKAIRRERRRQWREQRGQRR